MYDEAGRQEEGLWTSVILPAQKNTETRSTSTSVSLFWSRTRTYHRIIRVHDDATRSFRLQFCVFGELMVRRVFALRRALSSANTLFFFLVQQETTPLRTGPRLDILMQV